MMFSGTQALAYEKSYDTEVFDSLEEPGIVESDNNDKDTNEDLGEITSGNYKYMLLSDNTATLSEYLGDSTNVVIPSEIDGHKVTELFSTFDSNKSIVSVTIPDTVLTVGYEAFYECSSLQYVLFSDSVKTIEDGAFQNCTSLEEIRIPSSVTSIGAGAFKGCESLRTVSIPDSVTEVGLLAFEFTPWLTDNISDFVIVGDGVLICYKGSDTDPKIPDTVKTIGDGAFSYFFSPMIASSFTTTNITSVSIPDSVTSIGFRAFTGNGLTSINIPSSVKYVGDYAFSFTKIKNAILPYTVEDWGDGCFNSCEELLTVTITDGIDVLTEGMFGGCKSLTSVLIPDSVLVIDNSCFYECTSLKSIIIPESVKDIGSWAFGNCSSLERADFPGTDVGWEYNAFPDTVTIYCYANSEAHSQAKIDKIPYVLYDGTDTEINTDSNTDTSANDSDTNTDIDYSDETYVPHLRVSSNGNITNYDIKYQPEFDAFLSDYIPKDGDTIYFYITKDNKKIDSSEQISTLNISYSTENSVGSAITLSPFGLFLLFPDSSETDTVIDTSSNSATDTATDTSSNSATDTATDTSSNSATDTATDTSSNSATDTVTDTETIKLLGDINGDNKVTAKDSMQIQRFVINLSKLDENQKKLADVDGNNKVTNADALSILRYTIKAKVKYPIGQDYDKIDFSDTDYNDDNYKEFDFHGLKFKKMGDVFKYKHYDMGYKDNKFFFIAFDEINGENVLFRTTAELSDEYLQAYADVVKSGAYAYNDVYEALKNAPITGIEDLSDKIPTKDFLASLTGKKSQDLNDMGFKVKQISNTGRECFVTYANSTYSIRVYFFNIDYSNVLPFDSYFEGHTIDYALFERVIQL